MRSNFDPFRFEQRPEPVAVPGQLSPVCLVENDDEHPWQERRPAWHRSMALAIIMVIALSTALITNTRLIAPPQTPSTAH
jgi:hypothetical protein